MTAGLLSAASMVVVAPLAAVGSVPTLEAAPSAATSSSAVDTTPAAVESTITTAGETTLTLPDSPPPSTDQEILALAARPAPGADLPSPPETSATTEATAETGPEAPAGTTAPSSTTSTVAELTLLEATEVTTTTQPPDPFECHRRAAGLSLADEEGSYDRNLVAQLTYRVFECVAEAHGYGAVPAESTPDWDAAGIWGFDDMAELIAAEAVVVGYCESQAFAGFAIDDDNPWGYGGVFQMGDKEMRLFGFPGASKFHPVDNVYSAATYLLANMERGLPWGGWGPWAVVNTGYNDPVNDKVKIPVLPRFHSTDPKFRGRRGVELPAWAVDPWSWEVPDFDGCPFTGRDWPAALPLDRSAV